MDRSMKGGMTRSQVTPPPTAPTLHCTVLLLHCAYTTLPCSGLPCLALPRPSLPWPVLLWPALHPQYTALHCTALHCTISMQTRAKSTIYVTVQGQMFMKPMFITWLCSENAMDNMYASKYCMASLATCLLVAVCCVPGLPLLANCDGASAACRWASSTLLASLCSMLWQTYLRMHNQCWTAC